MKNGRAWSLLLSLLVPLAVVASEAGSSHQSSPEAPRGAWHALATNGSLMARHESAATLVAERLYVFGGRGERPLQALDLRTRQWSTLQPPPLEIHHVQAVSHDGKIHVISGFTGGFPDETPLSHVLVFDPVRNAWSRGPEIPAQRRRGAAGVVVHDGVAYVVGGNTAGHNSGYVAWVDALDLRTGAWTALPDAPRPRDHFQAAVVGEKLYAAGGRLSSQNTDEPLSKTVKPVDVFDLASRTWGSLEHDLPTARAGSATVALNGLLVVLGGESDKQVPAHAEVEAFDVGRGVGRELPALPIGRHGMQAVTYGKAVYVAAGSRNRGGGPELDDVWVLEQR